MNGLLTRPTQRGFSTLWGCAVELDHIGGGPVIAMKRVLFQHTERHTHTRRGAFDTETLLGFSAHFSNVVQRYHVYCPYNP